MAIPIRSNSPSVRFRDERRPAALRCCVNANCAAIVSARRREHRPPRTQSGTRAFVVVRNWAMVRPSLFSPMLLAELAQEQMAHAGQHQMSPNRDVLADLEVIQPQFV